VIETTDKNFDRKGEMMGMNSQKNIVKELMQFKISRKYTSAIE
jgi:hypothetical protein